MCIRVCIYIYIHNHVHSMSVLFILSILCATCVKATGHRRSVHIDERMDRIDLLAHMFPTKQQTVFDPVSGGVFRR